MTEQPKSAALHRYRILDTPHEREFDEVVQIAAVLCGTSMALISLLDQDRLWFKAAHNFDASQVDRSLTFCDHAIQSGQTFIVEDAAQDARFAKNPRVLGVPFIRFYAGVPLRTPGGEIIGTICVVDPVPQKLKSEQIAALEMLAVQIIRLLEARLSATQEREARDELERKNQLFDAVLEHMADGVVACDEKGQLTLFNRASREMHGIDARGGNPEGWTREYSLFAADGTTPLQMQDIPLFRAYRGEIVRDSEMVIAPANLMRRSVVASGRPLKSKDGRKLGAVVTMRDTTAQREILNSAAEIRANESKLRKIFSSGITGIIFFNSEGKICDANETFLKLVGYSNEDLREGRIDWRALTPPEYVGLDEQAIHQIQTLGACVPYEKEYIAKDGKRIPILISAAALEGTGNEGVCFVVDMTKQKTTEKRFRAMMEQSPMAIQLMNPQGDITKVNASWLALWQLSKSELKAEDFQNYNIFRDVELSRLGILDYIQRAFAGETVVAPAVWYDPTAAGWAGRKRWIEWHLSPLRDELGKITEVIAVTKDLTHVKLTEEETTRLKVSETAANEASRLKSEFLANMSHEIRTPINGVIGMTSLLLDSPLSPEQRDYAENVKRSADSLLTVINDILDFSKVEAGKLELEVAPFDLEQLIHDTHKTLQFEAVKRKIAFLAPGDLAEATSFLGDSGRIRQVLLNLLGNALKFTEKGRVELRVVREANNDGAATFKFEVHDTGIGIPPAALARMFQSFSQADASVTRRFGGTGLGLSISKRLVELMRGEIGVVSEQGKGSTFWFRLTLPKGAAKQNAPQTVPSLAKAQRASAVGARILIAEDNPVNQKIAVVLLQKMGYRADVVGNGLEAIDLLRSINYDLVLMDCHMPEMDGYEATRRIRQSETMPFRNVPIIACTANAMDGEKQRCLEVGMDDYLSKPFQVSQLEEILERWLGGERRRVA